MGVGVGVGIAMAFRIARRAREAPAAVIDELLAKYVPEPEDGWVNLAPGVAHFGPPGEVEDLLRKDAAEKVLELSKYGDVAGERDLLDRIKAKLTTRNGLNLEGKEIMVTAGANQAFVNVVMALVDPGEEVVLFRPYYFSHWTAIQISGGVPVPTRDTTEEGPTLEALREVVTAKTRAVFLVTPSNPTGQCISKSSLAEIHSFCLEHGIWLVVDEAYENFVYDDASHESLDSPNGVINIYTMSKTYGLAGWRIGYMIFPSHLASTMAKIQDTIPTHASLLSQRCAAVALQSDPEWIRLQVEGMSQTRDVFLSALKPVVNVKVPGGAFYLFLKVPAKYSDVDAVDFLAQNHKVLVVPGYAFGAPEYVRVSFGSIAPQSAEQAARRLANAFAELVK